MTRSSGEVSLEEVVLVVVPKGVQSSVVQGEGAVSVSTLGLNSRRTGGLQCCKGGLSLGTGDEDVGTKGKKTVEDRNQFRYRETELKRYANLKVNLELSTHSASLLGTLRRVTRPQEVSLWTAQVNPQGHGSRVAGRSVTERCLTGAVAR